MNASLKRIAKKPIIYGNWLMKNFIVLEPNKKIPVTCLYNVIFGEWKTKNEAIEVIKKIIKKLGNQIDNIDII
jgi:hypothetical protein